MSETIDLTNLSLEFDVIAFAIQRGYLPDNVKPEIFAGTKTGWIAQKMAIFGSACAPSLLVAEMQKEGGVDNVPELEALLERLKNQQVSEDSIPDMVKNLQSLATGRKLANLLAKPNGIAEKLKKHNVDNAVAELESFLFSQKTKDDVVAEGSFLDAEQEIITEIEHIKANPNFTGIPTYIPELDEAIQGLLPAEVGLWVGGTGEGKSIAMLDVGMRAWENGKNVLGITIEMKKRQQEFRQLSWACGIDSLAFRTGNITDEEVGRVKTFFEERRSRENIFYWVDIPSNVNAAEIERKVIQTERAMHKTFDLLIIDYLGIMSPIGKFDNRNGWDSLAETAWNVHNLARRTNKAIWSAAQKKENITDKEKARGGLSSIGLSYLIAQPLDIVLVLVEDVLGGSLDVNIAKGRPVKKTRLKLKPDFRYSRISRFQNE